MLVINFYTKFSPMATDKVHRTGAEVASSPLLLQAVLGGDLASLFTWHSCLLRCPGGKGRSQVATLPHASDVLAGHKHRSLCTERRRPSPCSPPAHPLSCRARQGGGAISRDASAVPGMRGQELRRCLEVPEPPRLLIACQVGIPQSLITLIAPTQRITCTL